MKKEIRNLLLTALAEKKQGAEYADGEYSLKTSADDLELYAAGKLIARFTFSKKILFTADWEYKKENRYLAYLLEQNGYEVNADDFLRR
ncbi:MAG: hypothetical protein K0R57_5391 [Paenibacillaceae bacterium]|jgi:hypothetical protein|nr:hypothetical protein [Paenibacillaceae bacterium]